MQRLALFRRRKIKIIHMTPKTFAACAGSNLVNKNLDFYKAMLASDPTGARDDYWKRAIALYSRIPREQQLVLVEIMRQTIVDTISNVFAILDGVTTIESPREEFTLTSESDPQKINGDLQELFLESEEEFLRKQNQPTA